MTENNRPEPPRATAIPLWVFAIALVVALLHLAPMWRAQLATPDGWHFTGNLASVSPDAMQYRVWYRQTGVTGPLADNRFTTEANPAHLPLVSFWVLGRAADLLGVAPEFVSQYAGALIAFVLALLVFVAVRRFSPPSVDLRWAYPLALLAGGLGVYFEWIERVPVVGSLGVVQRLVVQPAHSIPLWEEYRGNYTYQALLDPHSGLQWVLVLLSLLAFHRALVSGRRGHLIGALCLYVLTAVLHLYTGITLMAATLGIVLACRMRGVGGAAVWRAGLALAGALGLTLACLYAVFSRGGLPMSSWTAPPILLSVLLLAYPVVFAALLFGGRRLLDERSLERTFVLGWAAGCLAVLVSSPFYPFADRGAISAQIPLVILAASAWFAHRRNVPKLVAVAVVLASAVSPLMAYRAAFKRAAFRDERPAVFLDRAHEEILAALKKEARTDDVLCADEADLLWLAPVHPGRMYCGHFFLTVDYEKKLAKKEAFFERPDDEFLGDQGIDLLFVANPTDRDGGADGTRDASLRLAAIKGLSPVLSNSAGTLYRYGRDGARRGE